MVQQMQQTCPDCNGDGEIINAKDRCKGCNGKKTVSERKVLEVHIDRGMRDGQTVTFNGEADQAPGVQPGDVVIVVDEKPHEFFKRKGDDLFCDCKVDLLTALAGGSFNIPSLEEDKHLKVTILPGEVIKPGPCDATSAHLTAQARSRCSTTRACPRGVITSSATFTSRSTLTSPTRCPKRPSRCWSRPCPRAGYRRRRPRRRLSRRFCACAGP